MNDASDGTGRRLAAGSAARRQRAERILDATGELLLRHGYKRVTIDDVARLASIGKGTIYLHWKTREALFWAVLQRDTIGLLSRLVNQLRTDPELALPGALMRAIFLEASQRLLIRALLVPDPEVLGSLASDPAVAAAQRELSGNENYLVLLQEQGLLRPGLTPAAAGHVLGSVMRGFFASAQDSDQDNQADLLADVLRRALEPDGTPPPARVQALAERVTALFTTIIDGQQAQLESAYR